MSKVIDHTHVPRIVLSDSDLDAMGLPSRPTRWRMRQEGDFPHPFKIGKRRVGYLKSHIDRWLEERVASSLAEHQASEA